MDYIPLSEKLRPKNLDEYVGQVHLIGQSKPIRRMIETNTISSMILWGPPGVGKTTLASIIAHNTNANFVFFSAVTSGVADVRKVIAEAQILHQEKSQKTILFIDEIHRFNKGQQDAFLPHVENGTIVLIGATTENPGFRVNAPLISRSQVYALYQLEDIDVKKLIDRAILEFPRVKWDQKALDHIAVYSNGDARVAINAVELAATLSSQVTIHIAEEAIQKKTMLYDKKGDNHYDTVSAFIKSMRGSDPDATLHYFSRMIKAGEDPIFIARRMVIFASEDIGNAQPTALVLATSSMQAIHLIGMPEAQLILAQCATYLATAKKSIASTVGLAQAMADIDTSRIETIPLHLRNPVNKVMKQFDYGKDHVRYIWKEEKETGQKTKQEYMPKNLVGRKYYKKDW